MATNIHRQAPPIPGKRRPVNKTFSGCARCKSSKVKCDEAKPSCGRCVSRKLPCPGYPGMIIRWSTKHEVFNSVKDPSLICNTSSRPALNSHLSFHPTYPKGSPPLQKPTPTTESGLRQTCSDITSCSPAESSTVPDEEENTPISAIANGSYKLPSHGSAYLLDTNSSMGSMDFTDTVPSLPGVMQYQDNYQWLDTSSVVPWKKASIPPAISHLPADLATYYFKNVCSVFSSFDSELNPFRSYVSQVFSYSAPVFNAMLSGSAARLADEKPQLKVIALQYQSQALRCIAESLKQTNKVREDTLFAIFLIGLSTAWHDGKDIGIAHFHAAQRAISSNAISARGNNQSMANFFKSALIYWEMAISIVSDEVEFSSDLEAAIAEESPNMATIEARESTDPRITPHPWTGVSSPIQAIFSRVTKVIRSLRLVDDRSDAGRLRHKTLSQDATKLEEALWSVALPDIAEIDDSGDPNTPSHHHVLLAEAYIFGSLYQIYRKFPGILRHRQQCISSAGCPPLGPKNNPIAEWWNSLSNTASNDMFLRSLGFSVLDRLQQIPITSGTRSVQAILIFVAAGSLAIPSPFIQGPIQHDDCVSSLEAGSALEHNHVMDLRDFTISRLASLRSLVHSRPVDLMLQVIKEMYRRLDMGEEVFWIDLIREMECETMFG
ncbi:fungal-specific transcription factor domain-containing protein [Trichoderma sp. SZMC 28012]